MKGWALEPEAPTKTLESALRLKWTYWLVLPTRLSLSVSREYSKIELGIPTPRLSLR